MPQGRSVLPTSITLAFMFDQTSCCVGILWSLGMCLCPLPSPSLQWNATPVGTSNSPLHPRTVGSRSPEACTKASRLKVFSLIPRVSFLPSTSGAEQIWILTSLGTWNLPEFWRVSWEADDRVGDGSLGQWMAVGLGVGGPMTESGLWIQLLFLPWSQLGIEWTVLCVVAWWALRPCEAEEKAYI